MDVERPRDLAGCQYALDTTHPTPPRAAFDDLDLEPAACVRDDQGVGRRGAQTRFADGPDPLLLAGVVHQFHAGWPRELFHRVHQAMRLVVCLLLVLTAEFHEQPAGAAR